MEYRANDYYGCPSRKQHVAVSTAAVFAAVFVITLSSAGVLVVIALIAAVIALVLFVLIRVAKWCAPPEDEGPFQYTSDDYEQLVERRKKMKHLDA